MKPRRSRMIAKKVSGGQACWNARRAASSRRTDLWNPTSTSTITCGVGISKKDLARMRATTGKWTSAGTNVPYACPNCRTSYSGRVNSRYRLSPLRNFRAGFAKTTQLLATELFGILRLSSPDGVSKLVSFSDSRQDAAKTSLSVGSQSPSGREARITGLHPSAARLDSFEE